MQQHLYLTDTCLGETVTTTPARGRTQDGRSWLALADNIFPPQGGGRPSDTGRVDGRPVRARRDADGLVVHALLGTPGFQHAGNSHFPGQARVDYRVEDREVDRDELTARLNRHFAETVAAGLPVRAELRDGVRTVSIDQLGGEPCGGSHVRDLSALREVSVRSVKVRSALMNVGYTAAHF